MKYSLIFKLCGWSLILFCYIVGFGIILIDEMGLQICAFGIIQVVAILMLGLRKYVMQYRLILPFIITLSLMYTLFSVLGIAPKGNSAALYWFTYGFPRILLLVSTIMLFRITLQSMKYQEVLAMKVNIHVMKYLILGRILYFAAFQSYGSIRNWQNMVPSMQTRKKSIKNRFTDGLSATLALILFVLAEAKQKGEAIDSRISLCYKDEK